MIDMFIKEHDILIFRFPYLILHLLKFLILSLTFLSLFLVHKILIFQ